MTINLQFYGCLVVGVFHNMQPKESKCFGDAYKVALLEAMVCQVTKRMEHMLL
jgi:hypothetical protein